MRFAIVLSWDEPEEHNESDKYDFPVSLQYKVLYEGDHPFTEIQAMIEAIKTHGYTANLANYLLNAGDLYEYREEGFYEFDYPDPNPDDVFDPSTICRKTFKGYAVIVED